MNKLCFYFQICMIAITLHSVSCQVTQVPDKIAIGQLDTAIPVE